MLSVHNAGYQGHFPDAAQGDFIYEKDEMGGTGGGSSGSLAYTSDLRVVGQELGGCGLNVESNCVSPL